MKQSFTYGMAIAALLMGAEAFPNQAGPIGHACPVAQSAAHANRIRMAGEGTATRSTGADIITETPVGELRSYYRNGKNYSMQFSSDNTYQLLVIDDQYVIGEVVETEDGTVYFRNPVMGLPTYSYMKGSLQGDEIVFQLPQPVIELDGLIVSVGLMRLNTENPDDVTAELVEENNEVRYSVNADGSYRMQMQEGYLLGYFIEDDGGWLYEGNVEETYFPFNEKPVALPDGVEAELGQMTYGMAGGRLIKIAVDGDDFYIGNLYDGLSNGWAKGTISDGKVIFEPYQYLGPSEEIYHYIYFTGADINEVLDPETDPKAISLVFEYDAKDRTLTYTHDGDAIMINGSPRQIYYIGYYDNPAIRPYRLVPLVPRNPDVLGLGEFYGFQFVDFTLSDVSMDGRVLDADHYFYSIYLDDELMEFYPDEYPYLTGMTTEMPVNLYDPEGFYVSEYNGVHEVFLFSEGFEKVGVQAVYVVDGVTNRSDIVYSDGTVVDSGVETVGSDNIKSVEYYDIAGRRVHFPSTGVYIRRWVTNEGVVKTDKVVSTGKRI